MPNTVIKVRSKIRKIIGCEITQNKICERASKLNKCWLGLPVIEIIISNKEWYATSICDSSQYQQM